MTSPSDSDHLLLAAFESCSLPAEQWTHRCHVRVAYLYAERQAHQAATDCMRRGIQAFNHASDTPETIDRGYRETITQAFMRLICAALHEHGPTVSSAAFCDAHPELLNPSALQTYYSDTHLRTAQAKAAFVEPDLSPLPEIDDSTWQQDLEAFLEPTEIIDSDSAAVQTVAATIRERCSADGSFIRHAFDWVRDSIQHSIDFDRCEVTCQASDVLKIGTGFCYAKSHLLAAILRAGNVPTGFCYQRLSLNGAGPPYCLHGLNAVLLPEHGWYRLDARGNRTDVQAEFTPPVERLAFHVTDGREFDDPRLYSHPLPVVVSALQTASSVRELLSHLPDTEITGHQQD